ncbi:putative cyclin-dependent kinase F-2 [Dichanthelium oligosanthes]|uniref:[RNA-polymerase]-subunit kinase n=1 Tax=Dichanthelium oligosanthes TaxID=888268 RepID=A0A1E5VQZ0_9POAL|nr:putative cyclin-dependent kinase F-2 [Dichanthelium oligosanthes]
MRKRPAPDGTAAGESKRARITLGSIYDYEKLEVLGEGSFGLVVKARHRATGEAVAVKRARASDLLAVLREAGCLAACRGHSSVVGIRDVVEDAATGDVFLVMEFVGASLRRLQRAAQRARPRPRFLEAEARAIMRQLLRGAERMHGAGIIHRDIKPDNILVGPGGAVKICDLGLATPARPEGAAYPERRVGTLLYRSPEQLVGRRDYGPGVDIWALGCVMAELLTGQFMFDEETEDDMLTRVMDLRHAVSEKGLQAFDEWPTFQGLPELSPGAREVLAGLLAVQPQDRLTATAALQHQWFAEEEEEEEERPVATCRSVGRAARSSSASVVTVVV